MRYHSQRFGEESNSSRRAVCCGASFPECEALVWNMDYDATEIPAGYDRGRDHGPEVLDLWMNAIASHLGGQSINTILDLGCGTGRFSEALAIRFDAEVIGIDPSKK